MIGSLRNRSRFSNGRVRFVIKGSGFRVLLVSLCKEFFLLVGEIRVREVIGRNVSRGPP